MKVFNNIVDLSKELGLLQELGELEEAFARNLGYDYFIYKDIEIKVGVKNNNINFILLDNEDDTDCKKYFMEYEKNEYRWIVYVDDIEKWQECKVLDVNNTRLGINRATVVTTLGTQVNRCVKFITGPEDTDFKQDRCIYFFEDLDDEDTEYWNGLINKDFMEVKNDFKKSKN